MSITNREHSEQIDKSKLDRIELGKKLKESREYLNLSQDEVAKEVGISRAAISLVESGQRRVEVLELKEFARIYQKSASFFTGQETEESKFSGEIKHLARAFEGLSEKDREELKRFAEFLQSRNQAEN